MRCHIQFAQRSHMIRGVVGLILAYRNAVSARFASGLQHGFRCPSLGRASCLRDRAGHRQTMAVFHGHMPHVAELRFPAGGLPVEAALGIGHAGMRLILTLLAVKVRAVVAAAILRTEALLRALRWLSKGTEVSLKVGG